MQYVGWSELLACVCFILLFVLRSLIRQFAKYGYFSESALHEQALNLVHNLTENEVGINLVLENLPSPILFRSLVLTCIHLPRLTPLCKPPPPSQNLANGPPEVQTPTCVSPGILSAVGCTLGSAAPAPGAGVGRRCKEMTGAGVRQALRSVVESGVAHVAHVGSPVPTSVSAGTYGTFGIGSPERSGCGGATLVPARTRACLVRFVEARAKTRGMLFSVPR